MTEIDFNGRRIRCEWLPALGTPKGNLLLLHSIGLSLEDSDPLLPYLRHDFNVLRYDLFGHGHSHHPDEPITIRLLLEQLDRVSAFFFRSPFAIVANNATGYLASRFCRLHEDRVTALIMISPPPVCLPLQSRLDIAGQLHDQAEAGFESYKQFMLSQITTARDPAALSVLRDCFDRTTKPHYFDCLIAFVIEDFSGDFAHIRAPVLVLSGIEDTLVPLALYGVMASYIGALRYEAVPHASTLAAFDNPAGAAAAILRFLDEAAAGRVAGSVLRMNAAEIAGALRNGFAGADNSRRLTVSLLHTFRVQIGDTEITKGWNVRKAKSLLLYMLLHQTVRREELIDVFWPELEIGKARNRLRVSLNYLKTMLNREDGTAFLHIDREHVFLQGNIDCDAFSYMQQLAAAHNEPNPATKLSLAQRLLSIAPHKLMTQLYDDWFLGIRESVESQYCALCEWTAQQLRNGGQPDKAAEYVRKAARITATAEENA